MSQLSGFFKREIELNETGFLTLLFMNAAEDKNTE